MTPIPEPPIHDDDTSPSVAVRPADLDARLEQQETISGWRRAAGWISLLGAAVFTLATFVVLLWPRPADSTELVQSATDIPVIPSDVMTTSVPTQAPLPTIEAQESTRIEQTRLLAAAQVEQQAELPLELVDLRRAYRFEPLTIVNTDRARSDFIDHIVVQGDTIDELAQRYGLTRESLAWCNDRNIVLVLRPGDILRIPPVDGACHEVLGTREETIAEIAEDYNVDDPFSIIDSPYNFGELPSDVTPNDILLGGTSLFIPGGEGPIITWNPGRDVEVDSATGQVLGVTFAPGQSGSCGRVAPAGGSAWVNPLPNGTWVRGFFAGHSGIDLAAPTGTPIRAANSGYVLFSGFSRWGYGEAVVIEHGSVLSTLYGHMSSRAVSCGQFIAAGQVIGYVGSTGNSSGPHLHFEIRSNDTPQDPTATVGLGF